LLILMLTRFAPHRKQIKTCRRPYAGERLPLLLVFETAIPTPNVRCYLLRYQEHESRGHYLAKPE